MRKKFLNLCMSKIHKKYPEYSNDKLDEIEYGIEALYITFTKTIVISLAAIILGVFKEVFLILIFYNIIRTVAFGMHAKTSFQCYVLSFILFIGAALICKYGSINVYVKIIISIICFINIIIYAPADTYKRPLINKKKRKIYKLLSIILSFIYVILIIIFNKNMWTNYIFMGLLDSTLMIHPLTYWVFHLPYNNYKTYNEVYS